MTEAATYLDVDVVLLSVPVGEDGPAAPEVWLTSTDDAHSPLRLPGRPLGADQDLEAAAAEVLRTTGVGAPRHTEQLASFGRPDRVPDRRAVSVTYLALIPHSRRVMPPTGKGTAPDSPTRQATPDSPTQPAPSDSPTGPVRTGSQGRWHVLDEVDESDLAWDHCEILTAAVQRVRSKLSYSNIAFALLEDEFTMSELQAVYEGVLGTTLDKRNFRRKISSLGLLAETGGERRGSHRPARLFTSASDELVLLDQVIATP